ncbi:MAG: hemerythrin domain-containing protein [Bacteroidales bacterium]|nr:hemerythrin domain-containing protein [Bacteroidales bacterium]
MTIKNGSVLRYSSSMKMAELMEGNSLLLGVLQRLGLGFGFGEETVEEVCEKAGVSADTFLLICNVYTIDGYMPSHEVLRKVSIKDIVKYLHQSHDYYTGEVLTELEEAIGKMIEPCDAAHKKIIRGFFAAYKEELAKHFQYEETVVFPYVATLLQRGGDKNFSIEQFEENHSNIDEKLGDLINIVMKYMPAECNNLTISNVLLKLFLLRTDLEKHTSIEDNILVPAVNKLERHE